MSKVGDGAVPPWNDIDIEEPDWAGPGLINGGWLVFRAIDGTEVYRQRYECHAPTPIAILNATLRRIHRRVSSD